jgi:hypothetical protein
VVCGLEPSPSNRNVGKLQAGHPLKVTALSSQQNPIVCQHDSSNQAVRHPDALTGALQFQPYSCRAVGGLLVQWQGRQSIKQLPDGVFLSRMASAAEQLESSDGRGA